MEQCNLCEDRAKKFALGVKMLSKLKWAFAQNSSVNEPKHCYVSAYGQGRKMALYKCSHLVNSNVLQKLALNSIEPMKHRTSGMIHCRRTVF